MCPGQRKRLQASSPSNVTLQACLEVLEHHSQVHAHAIGEALLRFDQPVQQLAPVRASNSGEAGH